VGVNHSSDAGNATSWEADVEDDSGALLKTVGRQVKLWREAADFKQAELGSEIGYGEEMVSAVERGRRLPRPEFLDKADEVLGAGGKLSALKDAVAIARYPKKLRDLAKLEAEAVELGTYSNHTIPALLQTEDYARAMFGMRRPPHSAEVIDRNVQARMDRQQILDAAPTAPMVSFVLEEVTLLRSPGGRDVQREQLQRLLDVGQLRNTEIQVMPTGREDHAGLAGAFRLFKVRDGSTLGFVEAQDTTRLISEPREVQPLEMRYGILRAQALTPMESLAYIEKVWGDT